MATNVINKAPYLRSSRAFPDEIEPLVVEINRAYIDIASKMNDRVIGLFPTTTPAIGGEVWYISKNQRQQSLRQVYTFSDANLIINHGINFNATSNFVRLWGMFFDGTFWQDLPYVDVISATNQINVKISATQIIVTKGGGAPPAIINGLIIVEWLANP